MKAEVYKLDINKLVNVSTNLNNLKAKVDDLDLSKLKTVLVDFYKEIFISCVINTKISEDGNKISNVGDLVKKTGYDAYISDTEKKYFTTSDYNKFAKEILDAKMTKKAIVDKSDFSNLVKSSGLNTKLVTLATKAELKAQQNKLNF